MKALTVQSEVIKPYKPKNVRSSIARRHYLFVYYKYSRKTKRWAPLPPRSRMGFEKKLHVH